MWLFVRILAGVAIAAVMVLIAAVLRKAHATGADAHEFATLRLRLRPAPPKAPFRLSDPYAVPGIFRKAQLHVHTSESADVFQKEPVAETVRKYRAAGCSFVVLTDHDRVTDFTATNDADFVVVPGEEKTLPLAGLPFGRHLLRLGAAPRRVTMPADAEPELRAAAHPSWNGTLGFGRWTLADLLRREDLMLIEVLNGHSFSALDFWLWQRMLQERGWRRPVWGIAVDDTNNAIAIDGGWVMVKSEMVSRDALLRALRQGSFYATNGAAANFFSQCGAEGLDPVIVAEAEPDATIRFIDGRGGVVAATRASRAEYRPQGDETFVRVEVIDAQGRAAWSQPFFLIPTT